jgi:hypothetical protein
MNLGGPISFIGGFALMAAAGWVGLPAALYETKPQPLQFSHKAHRDKGSMACTDCHSYRADGSFSGIPNMEGCAGCHTEAVGETAAEKMFVEQFVKPARAPQWLVYSRQPVNVRFSHAIHTETGKLKCEECHGSHGETATLRPYQQNRISGYGRDIWGQHIARIGLKPGDGMKMTDCEDCHAKRGVTAGCLGCHK